MLTHKKFNHCPALTAETGITHGFFTRRGGVSSSLYRSLNVGLGSHDEVRHVQENRARVQNILGARHLITAYQIHSADAAIVEGPWAGRPRDVDALVTNTPGLALGILTADCVPVLFFDPKAYVIGAAHSGWKGLLQGIIETTVAKMEILGAQRHNILASIGPCIAQASYEVGVEMLETFRAKNPGLISCFAPGLTPDKRQFDIGGAVQHELSQAGLDRISRIQHDTYALESQYYSFRRATHRGENDYGRQISAIMLA